MTRVSSKLVIAVVLAFTAVAATGCEVVATAPAPAGPNASTM